MIKLTDRNLFIKLPGLSFVSCNSNSTIVSINYKIGIVRVYPKCMVIRVDSVVRNYCFKCFSAIFTHTYRLVYQPQTVFIFRVSNNILKIKTSVGSVLRVLIHFFPFTSTIFTFIQSTFCTFYKGINSTGHIMTNGNSYSTIITGW